MVRKIGNLSPISPPELYDISGENMNKVGVAVQQASQASMQALSALGQAYGANTQRLYNDQATLEKVRMMQAQADEQNKQSSGGVLGNLGQVFNSFVGGLTAAEDIKMKKQALEQEMLMKQTEAQRKAGLEERGMSLDESKFKYSQVQDVLKQQTEAEKETLENLNGYVKQALAESYATLETMYSTLTHEQGITYADKLFEQQAKQFEKLFEAYPTLRTAYYTGVAEIRQKLQAKYSSVYAETQKEDRELILNTQESKMQLAIATRKEEIGYAAGLWTEEQATQELNATINLAMQTVMQDPAFQQAVKQDPSLMGKMYGRVLSSVLPSWTEYAKKNAEIDSSVVRVQKANLIFSSKPDLSDHATISNISEDLQRLGLPQYAADPNSYPTSELSRASNIKKKLDAEEGLRVAVEQNDPMFSLDTPEHLFVANSLRAEELYSGLNQKDGLSIETIKRRAESKAKEARSRNDFKSESYWGSFVDFYKSFENDRKSYSSLQDKYRKLSTEYSEMVKPIQDTTVIPDGLNASRVEVGGVKLQPKFTEEQIEQTRSMMTEVAKQMLQVENKWKESGINFKDLSDPTYLYDVQELARPYKAHLERKLLSSGQVPNTGSEALRLAIEPTPQRVATNVTGVKPLNFTGGKTETSQVVQAKANALPFPKNAAPLTPSVPVKGTLATLKGVGIVPFKGGNVSIVDEGTKGLTLTSTDSRVATMVGGKVVYSGGTQTMGNVVVIQTSDGLAEVYSNVNGATVKAGDYAPIGTTLGTSNKLEFQVWQTNDALAALRKEGLRNELEPLQYLKGVVTSVKLPNGLGSLDITKNRPTVVAGGNSNMFASGDYSVYGDMVFDKRTNEIRKLTKKESSYLYPDGMKTERAKANTRYNSNQNISQSVYEEAAQATRKFDGGKNNCARVTQAYGTVLGLDLSMMDATADSAKRAGMVLTDFSKLRKGDIIGWSGTAKFGDEHVGIYLGDGKVFHQSRARGLKSGAYPDLEYFKKQKGAYFVRPFRKGTINDIDTKNNRHGLPEPSATDTFNTGDSRQTANLRAFAGGVTYAEGTGTYGYATYFGGSRFDNSQPHPEKVVDGSSAAGQYQFMPKTWRWIHGGKNPPMTPANQDAAFIFLLKYRGVYEDVLNGNFEKAYKGVSKEWASIKGNNYTFKGKPQARYSPKQLAERARADANKYNRSVSRQSNPVASTITDRPQKLTKASTSPSAYGKPNPDYNFGYVELTKNRTMREALYKASISTGVPQQFLADIFGHHTRGFTDKNFKVRDIKLYTDRIKGSKGLSITEASKRMGIPQNIEDVGKEAARSYTNTRKEYHTNPVSHCTICQQILRSGQFFVQHFGD